MKRKHPTTMAIHRNLSKGSILSIKGTGKPLVTPSRTNNTPEKANNNSTLNFNPDLAAIYVDGPVHEYPERSERDAQQTDCLEDNGYTVIRFSNQDDWDRIIEKFPHIFGIPKK